MFIDDILAKVRPRSEESAPFLRDLRTSMVMKIHNVAEYMFASSKTSWDVTSDFSNIAPPYEKIWMEWAQQCEPKHGRACNCRNGKFRVGVALQSVDLNSESQETREWYQRRFPGAKWVTYGFFILDLGENISCPPALCWGVSSEGQPVIPSFLSRCHPLVPYRQLNDEDSSDAMRISELLPVPFMALTFMHIKNVRTIEGPAHSPRLQKARQDKGKFPLLRWHTLTVNPFKNAMAAANEGNTALTPKALHRIRGHYKNYTGDHPLFGKYTGMYWWDAHARGSHQAGIVLKDYRVLSGPAIGSVDGR